MVAIRHIALSLTLTMLTLMGPLPLSSTGHGGSAVDSPPASSGPNIEQSNIERSNTTIQRGEGRRFVVVRAVRGAGAEPRFPQPRDLLSAAGCSHGPRSSGPLASSRRSYSHGFAAQTFRCSCLWGAARLSLSKPHLSGNVDGMLASPRPRRCRSHYCHCAFL
jgi:hypothetical protein